MVGHATCHARIGAAHAARLVAALARIQAQSIDARLLRGTIAAGPTAGHASAALAQLPGRTGARLALGAALSVRALLAARALRIVVARLRTEDALLVALTVRIAMLQRLRAALEAITDHTGRAGALHGMIVHRALGARAAHRPWLGARIGALLLNARQMTGTLAIRSTARHAGQILADITSSALVVAPAHWLADAALAALIADALRVRTARRPTQRIRTAETAGAVARRCARRCWCPDAAESWRRIRHHAVQA